MPFEILGPLDHIETIAAGDSLRVLARLRRRYGRGRWRKKKGFVVVRLGAGRIVWAELHWYEAHGLGRRELKIRRIVSQLR
ncbi:MAG: hypothetical protein ACT4PU_06725 [Planctomycetota bacterium]